MTSSTAPPAYSPSARPPAGVRLPLSTNSGPAPQHKLGPAPFADMNGSPVYVASALVGRGVQPCKVCPGMGDGGVRVPYGGHELCHRGRYDILPITAEMEWVPTSEGNIPKGRSPVEGGFEESGEHLHHALVTHRGELPIPGKAGAHLGGAHYSFGGAELAESENYQVLCWK